MTAGSTSVGRAFVELAGDTTSIVKSIQDTVRVMSDADAKLVASGARLEAQFQRTINPAGVLAEKLSALVAAGKDPTQVFTAYSGQLEKVTAAHAAMGQPLPDLIQKFNSMRKAGEEVHGGFATLGQGIMNFAQNPLAATQAGIGSLLTTLGPTAVGIGAIATGAITAAASFLKLSERLSETAMQLRNESIVSGLTIQDMQAMNRLATEAGFENSNLARILGMLNRELSGEGAKPDFIKVLNALRLEAGQGAADLSRGIVPLLDDLQARLNAVQDPFKRAEYVNAAFNRRQTELAVLLQTSKTAFSEQIEEIKKAGNVYGDETQTKLLRLHENLATLGRAWESVKIKATDYFVSVWEWARKPGATTATGVTTAALGPPAGLAAALVSAIWGGTEASQSYPEVQAGAGIGAQANIGDWQNAFRNAERRIAIAKEIAKGQTEDIALRIKIADLEKEFDQAAKIYDVTNVERLAREIAGLKEQLKLTQDLRKANEDALNSLQTSFTTLGGQAIKIPTIQQLIPGVAEALGNAPWTLSAITGQFEQAQRPYDWLAETERVQLSLAKDRIGAEQDVLKMERQGLDLEIGRTEQERLLIAERKIADQTDINAQEIIGRYDLRRLEIEKLIAEVGDPLKRVGMRTEAKTALNADMQRELEANAQLGAARIGRVIDQENLRIFERAKGYAGQFFDAMQKGWTGIADWLKSTFLNLVKDIFSNIVASLIAPRGGGGIAGALASAFSGLGTAGLAGGGGGGILGSLTGLFSKGAQSFPIMTGMPEAVGVPGGLNVGAALPTAATTAASVGLSAGASLGMSAAVVGWTMGVQDAYKRGNALEGLIIGGIPGLIAGLFGGGAARRAREAAMAAQIQSGYMIASPSTISRTGAFGMTGDVQVETDITGRAIARRDVKPAVQIIFNGDVYGMPDFEQKVAQAVFGNSQLADNIAYAAR